MAKGLYDEYYTNGKIELARTGKNVSLKIILQKMK